MTRTLRLISIFLYQDVIEELESMYKMPVDKVLEKVLQNLVAVKVIRRCAHCDKEMILLIPRRGPHPREEEWAQNVEGAQCLVCNPNSKWKRVEDIE